MTSRFSSTLVLGVLATMGVVAWGCGPGTEARYYCDGSGCFDCDAYGCSPVTSPAHPTCTGNSGCAPGSVCTATGCSTSCSTDAACPRGETCQEGLCAPPGKGPGTKIECTTKADCGEGKVCKGGVCEACGGSDGPCPCQTSKDCSGGLTCVGGSCTPPQNTCKYSSECADGKICADGQCLTPCEAGAACADGYTCDKGVCRPKPGGGTGGCTSNAQCTSPEAPTCVNGWCVKKCTGDAECGTGKYCNQGACVVDTRPKPNCTTDTECGGTTATPKKCLGGFCKFTCTAGNDQYCRTIDSRIGYCAKDNVCRSSEEAGAACTGPGECPNNQSCIDNRCL